jgi:hypothetical protein
MNKGGPGPNYHSAWAWIYRAPVRFQLFAAGIAAVSPWVVLIVASPSSPLLNAQLGVFFLTGALIAVWVYLVNTPAHAGPGVVVAYVLGGTSNIEGLFALFYYALSAHSRGAFEPACLGKIDAAYFTISTATTTGMGDIRPVSGAARLLVSGQMFLSLFLVVIAVGIAFQRFLPPTTDDGADNKTEP